MVDFTDCNYEESLVLKLEAASRDFFELTPNNDEASILTLNENTQALNRELNSYRKLKTELASSGRISALMKRKLRTTYVPVPIQEQFDIANIRTVKDFTSFVNNNKTIFREIFPNQERIYDAISSIDPIAFRTFESEYPSIAIRLQTGPISSAECDGLIKENGIDPKLFASQVKTKRKNILDLLNQFLSKLGIGIGIMGSFCSLVEDVFSLAKGQRDLTGNSAQFLGNFTNVLGLVNPKAAEILGNVQQLVGLVQNAQQASTDVANNIQGALSTLAGALGIAMKFADVLKAAQGNTTQESGIEVDWNLDAINDAILANDIRFFVVLPSTENPLGDINQDSLVNGEDSTALLSYIANTSTDEVKTYVDDIFIPYLNKNAASFAEFSNIPSAAEAGSSMSDILSDLSAISSFIGSGPGAGDFGLSKINQILTVTSGISSSIQSLATGSNPVNIRGLFSQLDQVLDLGQQATQGMFGDFNRTLQDYKKTAQNSLKEAEKMAVEDKPKAAEINEKNKQSLKTNITAALDVSAGNSKNLGSRLVQMANTVRSGIRQLAAVGVLENLNQQLSSVIDQSAGQLRSRIALFSPTSIGNGFNANMLSSFGKISGLIGQASQAASEQTTKAIKDSVTGMVAQASEKYRQKSKEEVEFVGLRFCKLAGEIERMYKQVTSPLEIMNSNFADANRVLSGAGSAVTLRAVQSGAIRLDTEARIAAMRQAGTIPANQSSPFITAAGTRSSVPPQGTYPIDVVPPLPGDYEFPKYQDARSGKGGVLYAPGPSSSLSGPAGFIAKSADGGVDTDSMRRLYLLAQRWGKTITVISAYRNPTANDGAGGKSGSLHLAGKAFDCDINTYDEQIQFANLAYQVGFRGIGSYLGRNTFVHIDTGNTRSWTKGGFKYYSLPGPPGAKIRG